MSNRREKIDPRQMEFDWDFSSKLEKVLHEREELKDRVIAGPRQTMKTENEFELCVLLAAGIKKAITESGLSREQMVDEINAYFGRTHEGALKLDPECRNPLTIHMFNKITCQNLPNAPSRLFICLPSITSQNPLNPRVYL